MIFSLTFFHFCKRPANENDTNVVVFQDDQQDAPGCWSQVGKQGGPQKIQLSNVQCYTKERITHEIYHSIGFYHEHTRPDRDQYVQVHDNCIRSGLKNNFKIQQKAETYDIPYDGRSIMHYTQTQGSNDENCKVITSKVKLLVNCQLTIRRGQT